MIHQLTNLVMELLTAIKNIVGSYGLAIVILTGIVKLIFWPITHKSTISMNKMQALQPKLKKLKEEYKDDRIKLNQKMQELWREEGVNPISGCLPILIQIPVFLVLYWTLNNAPELKDSSFLWIKDLSKPDTVAYIFNLPLNPLAFIMAGTMLVQQLMSPTSAEGPQAKMMLVMPIIFLFFFYSMPSGLTLYWTVNQIFTIIQLFFTNKKIKAEKN